MKVRVSLAARNNSAAMLRRRNNFYMRGIIVLILCIFVFLQYHSFNYLDNRGSLMNEVTNDSTDAILAMVPTTLHKFLRPRTRIQVYFNSSLGAHNASANHTTLINGAYVPYDIYRPLNNSEIKQQIAKYNELQLVLNEETFGPLQNDTVIIVVQVHTRIIYLRHLIVSLAQARDISKTLLIFSHDYYDEDINDLVQQIDFCKVMQIFYPYSIQTHPDEFPGADPNDCPRDINREQAILMKCNNAGDPDLYGHYREAKFTQTKHHWWWKANRVFNELEVTRYHTGLVLFLEEDHYVAEDFLYLLKMMNARTKDLCPFCNVLSLGTYLKTFSYYTHQSKSNKKSYASSLLFTNNLIGYNNNKNRKSPKAAAGSLTQSSKAQSTSNNNNNINNNINNNVNEKVYVGDTEPQPPSIPVTKSSLASTTATITVTTTTMLTSNNNNINNNNNNKNINTINDKNGAQTWSYHVLPSLYSIYQKVEAAPWISSKHNMGFAMNRTTWHNIQQCAQHFCTYDDYNWDWSLQHVSQQCLKHKLYAMLLKGPRVFHIGECGVHHKNKNCQSNQVVSKVQQVLRIARESGQIFPRSIVLTAPTQVKKMKLRKGNGGWGDRRDKQLCIHISQTHR